MTNQDLPVTFDHSVMAKLEAVDRASGKRLLEKLIRLFIDSTPDKLDILKRGLAQNDHGSVRKQAHPLKSSGAILGLRRFAYFCEKLELLEEAEDEEAKKEAPAIFELLLKEFDIAKEILIRISNPSASSPANSAGGPHGNITRQ